MIAELAAFNAAFGVVKQVLSNGRDIADCAKQIGVMIGAQEDCRIKSEKKSPSYLVHRGSVETRMILQELSWRTRK